MQKIICTDKSIIYNGVDVQTIFKNIDFPENDSDISIPFQSKKFMNFIENKKNSGDELIDNIIISDYFGLDNKLKELFVFLIDSLIEESRIDIDYALNIIDMLLKISCIKEIKSQDQLKEIIKTKLIEMIPSDKYSPIETSILNYIPQLILYKDLKRCLFDYILYESIYFERISKQNKKLQMLLNSSYYNIIKNDMNSKIVEYLGIHKYIHNIPTKINIMYICLLWYRIYSIFPESSSLFLFFLLIIFISAYGILSTIYLVADSYRMLELMETTIHGLLEKI